MKRKTTEEVLAESFQEVAAKKAVNRITIKDIVSNCGLSSTTFYRYYRDKEDLIAWIYKSNCRAILERLKDSPAGGRRWSASGSMTACRTATS